MENMNNAKKLENGKLKDILRKINTDSQTQAIYDSRLNRIMNFLGKTTGFKITAIKESGSRGKQTDVRKSDVDIIFCTGRNQDKNIILKNLLMRAKKGFKKNTKVHKTNKAVHIDFLKPKCNIDIVYLTNQEFKQEKMKIAQIKKFRPLHKNAIKLVKYALSRAKQKNIASHEVELACLTFNYNSLADCVYHLVTYFSGRLKQNRSSVDRVLNFLL
ncbi:hypothetical protein LCGC14_1072290 [marine sediment metagenome]|uniref:Polymerase nucleotidyl transferase domain-containing protein n=1 Tax=marine sediment metagenome TaxID=412755 RepID=A0A0F9QNQ2_9ZZZZ